MAEGVRRGDPKMKIATCAVTDGKSHRYAKSVDCFKGLERLYDVISFHSYAEVEGWPTWRRSYPEDGRIKFLKEIRGIMEWRDRNAPGKPVWLTEFGWDASTKPAPTSGDFAKWEGSTETQQAQWLVRAFLVFARIGLDRAYVFFYDDKDEPHVHGSSGITRDFKPKPAFHALAHLFRTLGEYRFERVVVEKEGELYAYDFRRGDDPKQGVRFVWSPTGSGRKVEVAIPAPPGTVVAIERMPLKEGPAETLPMPSGTALRVPVEETPVYILFREQ
jgi:serine/threonine-protein kinase ATR